MTLDAIQAGLLFGTLLTIAVGALSMRPRPRGKLW